MYPLKASLVGEATKLEIARQALLARTVDIEAALPNADATIAWFSQAPEARRLIIIYLAGSDQLDGVKRLRSTCLGQPLLGVIGEGSTGLRDSLATVFPLSAAPSGLDLPKLPPILGLIAPGYFLSPRRAGVGARTFHCRICDRLNLTGTCVQYTIEVRS
jgi:hypothetical protein